jgi:hypothetical protein
VTGTFEERKAESEKRLEQIRENGLKALEDPDFTEWLARAFGEVAAFHDALYNPGHDLIPLRATGKGSRRP